MERDALYYPNIQIPSVDWLKRSLLLFPHVVRVVPDDYSPMDQREVWEFENVEGRRGEPLLRRARLSTGEVWGAQRRLIGRLRSDIKSDEAFIRRFSKANATRFEKKFSEASFHLHPGKMTHDLIDFLHDHDLAWPALGERADRGFMRVHPLLGQLVMSTLAIACARDEGFNIVSESSRVHRFLANHDDLGAYKEFTGASRPKKKASVADGNKLFEVLVFQNCAVSKLTPEALAKLSDDREAIDDFKDALEKIAASIPEMQNEGRFEERVRAAAQDALKRWKRDRANMGSFARKLFGVEGAKPAGEVLKSVVEKGLPAVTGGGATGAALASQQPLVLSLGVGVAVAIATHVATSWVSVRDRERNSPFRYLSKAEDAGVVFAIST